MNRIYIDITQLYEWKGKLTGIQRVMEELSKRFIDDERFDPTFIAWRKSTASFYPVDFAAFLANRDVVQEAPVATNSPTKQLLKRIYHHVPLSRTMYNRYAALNGRRAKYLSNEAALIIEPNSVLFMPHGGVWDSQSYIDAIFALQAESHVQLVPVLFDLCPVISPQFVVAPVQEAFHNYMSQVLPMADLVLAISRNTANDASRWLSKIDQQQPAKIEVFRLGDEVGQEIPQAVSVPDKYVLCVGTIEARKNHAALYYAYKLAVAQGLKLPPIVFVGRVGWMASDAYQLMTSDPETKDQFIFRHDTNDDELAWLYEHALFSVYPSFYEGWGLPIAESLLRGTPCLASNTSSMPEIAGDLVDYFSPFETGQITAKIAALSNDPAALKKRKQQIKKGYKVTTWTDSYEQVVSCLTQL